MASVANAQYVIERERAAYDAGRVDALRELAGDLHPTRMWIPTIGLLNQRAAQIKKEARG
jgi:hypothetical protein